MDTDGELPIKFWARAFTRELEFPPTMAGFDELLGLVGGRESFVPQNFAEMTGVAFVPRVAVVDPGRQWSIQVASESIDIQCTPLPGTPLCFVVFCLEAGEQLRRVLGGREAKAHRLAVLWDRLLPTLPDDALDAAAT